MIPSSETNVNVHYQPTALKLAELCEEIANEMVDPEIAIAFRALAYKLEKLIGYHK